MHDVTRARPIISSTLFRAACRTGGASLLIACASAPPAPPTSPAPITTTPAPAVREAPPVTRVQLPRVQPLTRFSISAVTRFTVSGAGLPANKSEEQRVDTRASVSMSLTRTSTGTLRGSGQIDSFTVRNSAEGRAQAGVPIAATSVRTDAPALILIDVVLDSTLARVVMRPPLVNECDRPEVSAMQLARELLVRIPDGVAAGDQWRDSTVTLVCRNGVPLTVYTTTRSTLEQLTRETLVVTRDISTKLMGSGGTAFRTFEVVGTGSGSQRLEIAASSGVLERLQGASTLTLQALERNPPGAPRSQHVLQRVELRAERQR